jgi:HD-GYP domain-containing protein (c-di-GMP phosphodiesterase class II)
MLADRPYRRGRPVDEAVAEVRRCSGTQFDPEVVAALSAHLDAQGGKPDEVAEPAVRA